MTVKLSDEQRAAIVAHVPGTPVKVVDERTDRVFWLVAPEDVPALWAEHIDRDVNAGLAAIERGEIVAWNPEGMKERARAAVRRQELSQ
jgi:hypothetical protein